MIRQYVDINEFGFMTGYGIILQEKYLVKRKNWQFVFVDLKKTFDWVSMDGLWWALKKPVLEKWFLLFGQGVGMLSCIRASGTFTDDFKTHC